MQASVILYLPFRNYVSTKNGLINMHHKQQANIL